MYEYLRDELYTMHMLNFPESAKLRNKPIMKNKYILESLIKVVT